MKTAYLLFLTLVAVISVGSLVSQAHADDANDISIQNISVQPYAVKVGDAFTVTATLVNNSTVPIFVSNMINDDCQGPFFNVSFDNHVKVAVAADNGRTCSYVGLQQRLDPDKQYTGTSPGLFFTYTATQPGTANVTVTFPYKVKNQTDPNQSNIDQTISKSFLFTVSDNNTGSVKLEKTFLSPLQQLGEGIAANDVKCRDGLVLVIKSENGSPACVKPDTAQKLIERGWGTTLTGTTNKISSTDVCGQFYAAPGNQHDSNTVPVLLMNSNSTACVKLTFTIYSNYKDCNGQTCQNIIAFDRLHIGNLRYEKHDNMFSVSPGKDYTNSFNITTIPDSVDLANYPIGTNFTITYTIKPLPNATGFYDQSIPKLACENYPLAIGYAADQVNASDFSYINQLNPPCTAGGFQEKHVNIGDVVVASKIYDYHSGSAEDIFKVRPQVYSIHHYMEDLSRVEAAEKDWLNYLVGKIPKLKPTVLVDPIASGEHLVKSLNSSTYELIRNSYNDAVAVEMEGFGFASAAHLHPGLYALIIRGVSDLIDNKGEMDKTNAKEKATEHATAFAFNILSKIT